MFYKNFPTCTFILSYTSIRYTRVVSVSETYHVIQEPKFTVSMEKMWALDFLEKLYTFIDECCFRWMGSASQTSSAALKFEFCRHALHVPMLWISQDLSSVQTLKSLKIIPLTNLKHSLMNVVFLERSTRTSSAGSRFLVITLIEIQGIQIVSQPKHFSAQPIHLA